MVTVSYELVLGVFALGLGLGGLTCLIAVVLGSVWYNTRNKKDDDEDEDEGLVIPMSALMGGGAGNRAVSYADLQRAAAEVSAAQGQAAGAADKKGPPQTTAYL
jgi:hypothetical protein